MLQVGRSEFFIQYPLNLALLQGMITLALMDIVRDYRAQGFVSGIDILDPDEVAYHRAQWNTLENKIGKDRAQIGVMNQHREQDFIWKLATHCRILDAVSQILGPDIVLLGTHFFCKYPVQIGTDKPFIAWHQDVTYWGLTPPQVAAAWLAIDDVDIKNGAMRIIPRSHTKGIFNHGKSQKVGNLLSVNQEVDETLLDSDNAVDIELRAGQASLHDGLTVHGSSPNRSMRRRCGVTIRYITPKVQIHREPNQPFNWYPSVVRGEDRYQLNEYLPPL